MNSAAPTRPAFAAEPVTARTSSGYASAETLDPNVESSCPAWSSMKSRLRRSGAMLTTAAARAR